MVWFVVVLSQYVYNSFGITSVVAPSVRRIAARTSRVQPAARGASIPGTGAGKASCIRPSGIHPPLKNLCPFTPLLAVTGPVPRLSAHRFRTRILFLLFFFVSARTRLLPLCFPSCPTLRAFSCPIPPLFPAPVPRVRFHSCSRPDTCLQPVPAPVALPPRPYLSFPACS